jgi:hypothetical protein
VTSLELDRNLDAQIDYVLRPAGWRKLPDNKVSSNVASLGFTRLASAVSPQWPVHCQSPIEWFFSADARNCSQYPAAMPRAVSPITALL